ncbi:MAG: Gfo/Idh/MocA family oxidoreductase [Actinomycetota bacterium]|nr:Gfo/Idh/MocA family oxidoreductase [Actinomycetota bacterium]
MAEHDLRVGIIGVGMMGADHARRLAERTANASLVAVCDPDAPKAESLAQKFAGVRAIADPASLIADDDVDAVLIASPGFVHTEQLLGCIEACKPTLCEKPMTMDTASSIQVLKAERDSGKALIQIGFMRRFDPEYVQMKSMLDAGQLGRTLLLHNTHRNKGVPNAEFRSEMIIRDSLVHEVDVARFLFGQEIVAVQVLSPAPTSYSAPGVVDPQVAIFHMSGGAIVTNEVFVSNEVGYEVRCEAVAERGTVIIGQPHSQLYTTSAVGEAGAWGGRIPDDYRERFALAYDLEIQAWADSASRGEVVGPTSWDGYAATAVCTAGMQSLASGQQVAVELADRVSVLGTH